MENGCLTLIVSIGTVDDIPIDTISVKQNFTEAFYCKIT